MTEDKKTGSSWKVCFGLFEPFSFPNNCFFVFWLDCGLLVSEKLIREDNMRFLKQVWGKISRSFQAIIFLAYVFGAIIIIALFTKEDLEHTEGRA